MELKQQVTSLELSKRLKELRVKHESLWVWKGSEDTSWYIAASVDSGSNIYAYSVAELGEMLPRYTKCWQWHDLDKLDEHGNEGRPYWNCENEKYHAQETAATEADARAKMLVYLIENELLPTINK